MNRHRTTTKIIEDAREVDYKLHTVLRNGRQVSPSAGRPTPLYDMESDPGEKNDLSTTMPEHAGHGTLPCVGMILPRVTAPFRCVS